MPDAEPCLPFIAEVSSDLANLVEHTTTTASSDVDVDSFPGTNSPPPGPIDPKIRCKIPLAHVHWRLPTPSHPTVGVALFDSNIS